jgi:subtilase family serine protease
MKLFLIPALALSAGFTAVGQGLGVSQRPEDVEAHPPLHVRPDASTSPVGYVPLQIRHAYGIDLLPNGGAGQVIAIVDAYGSPTVQNDLNVFCDQFGLPRTTVQIVYGSGPRTKKTDAGWALETSLDVEWAHAVAPNAQIILAVGTSASIGNLVSAIDAATKAGATIVSMSWGGSEFSSEASYESHFQKTGVTFVTSSGDNGSGASWPATSPSVVSVGGTSLYLDSVGNQTAPETGWSGSGGGFSGYFSRPSYQNGWQANANRAFPDVSMVANPNTGVTVYDSTAYNGQRGWFQVGGTSASSPMWGGVIALANEQRLNAGKAALTGSDAALYSLAGSVDGAGASLYGYYFFDVSAGSNGGFSATAQYDEVTGLGTPATVNLVPALGN